MQLKTREKAFVLQSRTPVSCTSEESFCSEEVSESHPNTHLKSWSEAEQANAISLSIGNTHIVKGMLSDRKWNLGAQTKVKEMREFR
jgi:hypothetical protein